MSSKEQAHSHDTEGSKQRSPKPAAEDVDMLAQQQAHPATLIQQAGLDSRTLTPREVQQLQRTIGNRAVGTLLTNTGPHSGVQAQLTPGVLQNGGAAQREPPPQQKMEHVNFLPTTALPPESIQRLFIRQGTIDGLTVNFDTTHLDAAKELINELQDGGKRRSLEVLYQKIEEADKHEYFNNNKKLLRFIRDKLALKTSSVPENKPSEKEDTKNLETKYNETPIVTDETVQKGLRMWVSGDMERGISWNMIGEHLRGTLAQEEYNLIGYMSYHLQEQSNHEIHADINAQKLNIEEAKKLLDAARVSIRGALDALPDHDGLSYRQAYLPNGNVYGGTINVGDYIRDKTFWSTSALRLSGSSGKWGKDGTAEKPKVYFIITGSTGKYIPKHSGQEKGQHEVLFKDLVTFKVTKIGNFRGETFFVYVTEIAPTALPNNPVVKNPYNGAVYQ